MAKNKKNSNAPADTEKRAKQDLDAQYQSYLK